MLLAASAFLLLLLLQLLLYCITRILCLNCYTAGITPTYSHHHHDAGVQAMATPPSYCSAPSAHLWQQALSNL